MSCQPRPQPHANGTAKSSASSGTATKMPTRVRWPAPPGASRSGLACRGVFGAVRISGGAAISSSSFLLLDGPGVRGVSDRACGRQLLYAYVTVTYGDVIFAGPRRRFHQAVAILTPGGHRLGLTIRDDAPTPGRPGYAALSCKRSR